MVRLFRMAHTVAKGHLPLCACSELVILQILNGYDIGILLFSNQLFNDARRKTREPGKIHHVCDIRWKRLGEMRTYTLGKVINNQLVESPVLTWAKMATNVSILTTFHVLDF